MLPLFTFPLAFAALAAIPAVLAIYWLRNRFRRQPVSSLMLWLDHRQPREGGARIQRLQVPLLLVLELLILTLLALAATDPRLLAGSSARPLMIVLDDSYSMLAGEPDSPRSRGIELIRNTLRRHTGYTAHLILAGPDPQSLGQPTGNFNVLRRTLDDWSCASSSTDLPRAIAFAAQMGGPDAHVLVLTDHKPPEAMAAGRVQWQALGRPAANLAITAAIRAPHPSEPGDRCLIEVTNQSAEAASARLVVTAPPEPARQSSLLLPPNASQRVVFNIPPGVDTLTADLPDDALGIDNRAVLLGSPVRAVNVAVRLKNEELDKAFRRALATIDRARLDRSPADLLITDTPDPVAPMSTWLMTVLREPDDTAASYTGPYVLDRAHPLTAGLSLAGVIWGAGPAAAEPPPGRPVITVANTPLLTDLERVAGRHELHLRAIPELSTLTDTPNWPIFLWNLLDWRSANLPGLARTNVRLGDQAVAVFPEAITTARHIDPTGREESLTARTARLVFAPRATGIHHLVTDTVTHRFAVNALSSDESNLADTAMGTFGNWLDEASVEREYRSVAPLLILLAMIALAAHQFLIARASTTAPDGKAVRV